MLIPVLRLSNGLATNYLNNLNGIVKEGASWFESKVQRPKWAQQPVLCY